MFVRNAKWGIGQSKNTPCKWSKVYEGRSREPVHMQGPKTVKFAACARVGGNQIDSGSEEFSLIHFVSNYILLYRPSERVRGSGTAQFNQSRTIPHNF